MEDLKLRHCWVALGHCDRPNANSNVWATAVMTRCEGVLCADSRGRRRGVWSWDSRVNPVPSAGLLHVIRKLPAPLKSYKCWSEDVVRTDVPHKTYKKNVTWRKPVWNWNTRPRGLLSDSTERKRTDSDKWDHLETQPRRSQTKHWQKSPVCLNQHYSPQGRPKGFRAGLASVNTCQASSFSRLGWEGQGGAQPAYLDATWRGGHWPGCPVPALLTSCCEVHNDF